MAILYCWSGAAGSGSGADWTNAKTTLTAAFVTEVAGDTIYVAHDHAESTASAVTLTSSGTIALPTKVVCVDRAGTVPPVSADRRATAQVTNTIGNMTLNGYTHYDGIIFTTSNSFLVPNASVLLRFDNCSLRLASGTATHRFYLGAQGGAAANAIDFNNTTLSFSHISQTIDLSSAIKWRNTPSAIIGAAVPTFLFATSTSAGSSVECIGVDLSALGSGKTIANSAATSVLYRFVDCKLNASVTKSVAPTGHGSTEVDFIRSGSAGVNYTVHRHRVQGLLIEETTIVRTGGATDGTTPISWKVVTTANCNYSMPFECPVIAIWNDTSGVSKTATVEGVWGGGAVPNDDDVWLDLEYLGDASSPQGSFVNDGKANLVIAAAAQTSSTETWGGSTTKFKLAVTFTPQMKGWCYCRVKIGKASTTAYIDPLVVLT